MSVLAIEGLLAALSAAAPCGEDLEYDPSFAQLETLVQGKPERQYGDTIIAAEPPDWRSVSKTALALLERTRDLRIAVYLSQALLHTDGLAGFAEGLGVVHGFLEQFWDQVYPQLDPDDDNDPTVRINTVVALRNPETTLRSLRETPLVAVRGLGRFSLRDIAIASGALTPVVTADQAELPTQSKIDGAFQQADLETLQATARAVAEAIERVTGIEAVFTTHVGSGQAPDMSALGSVLKEIRKVLTDQLQRRGAGSDAETVTTSENPEAPQLSHSATPQPRGISGEIGSREDVIRTLDKICDYFERYEPSSPVPFLLKRAKKWVTQDFMTLLNDVAPGGTEQATLIFGLQKETSD